MMIANRMLLLGIALLASTVECNDKYVVLVPKVLRPGIPVEMSVSLDNSHPALDVTAEIISQGQTVTSQVQALPTGARHTLVKLDVPDSLKSGKATLSVSVGSLGNSQVDVTVQDKSSSVFIQMDKAIYKPSQTVNFRVVAVTPDMKPYNGKCNVEIKDSKKNKIKQWLNKQLVGGMLAEKLQLSDQPVLGEWTVKVTTDKNIISEKQFTIDKYVLPKFEVKVDMPSFMLEGVAFTDLDFEVESKYTYGEGVEGTAIVEVKMVGGDKTIQIKNVQLKNGKAKVSVPRSQLLSITKSGKVFRNDKIAVVANVTETLTGITRSDRGEVKVYLAPERLEFLDTSPATFKPGLAYTGFIKLDGVDGGLVSNPKPVTIEVKSTTQDDSVSGFFGPRTTTSITSTLSVTIPSSGFAQFSVDVPTKAQSVTLVAKYNNQNSVQSSKTIKKSNSPSNSFIQLLLTSSKLKAGDKAEFRVTATGGAARNVVYQVMSRGTIVSSGLVVVNGQSTVRVPVFESMAPSSRIIAYYITDDNSKELVMDSLNFNVEGAFKNKVAVSYSKHVAQPGDSVDVEVKADASSTVGLLAVDQSVLLLAGGNDITQTDVLTELASYDTTKEASKNSFSMFRCFWCPYSVSGEDATSIIDNSGLVVLTNTLVYKHQELIRPISWNWPRFGGGGGWNAGGGFLDAVASVKSLAVPGIMPPSIPKVKEEVKSPEPPSADDEVRVRKVFPESWLWTNLTTMSDGKVVLSTTVPDTITSWVASAFAIHPSSGLGVAETTATMEAFRPFFVSLNLPYSVVRGEQVVLQAIIFNYMETPLSVKVSLPKSSEYRSIMVDSLGQTTYVEREEMVTITAAAGQGTTVSFPIVPATIGNMKVRVTANAAPKAADAVERMLLVEAEGVEKNYNQAVMIDLKDQSTTFTKDMQIAFPKDIVADSTRIQFSLIGDIMGPSINGLDKLIKMPYGCGEQNMLNFAPTIFVTSYLKQSGGLTDKIMAKSEEYMEKGYQRELTYQRDDGSFSAFGQRDPQGSMWLTAFVAKSFQRARRFIYVDEEVILRATLWMVKQQAPDGSFPEPGRIIHKSMQGGAAAAPETLTAFVLAALNEVKVASVEDQRTITAASSKAKKYLESKIDVLSKPYDLALVSYALQMAGSQQANTALKVLENDEILEGGTTHWEQPQPEAAKNSRAWHAPHTQAKAINIELAAYALLTYASTSTSLTKGLSVLRWITQQRNENGGFSSTQDTVVALQALAQFASMYAANTDMKVKVTASDDEYNYVVNAQNSLVLQSTVLKPDVTSVKIAASGSGVALAQVAVTYNVEDYEQEAAFDTNATIIVEESNKLGLRICTRWLLSGATGMAVKEIGIPTGFSADVEGLEEQNIAGVKRIEQQDRKIIVYYDEIDANARCLEVYAERTGLVAKARPVAVKVYDYYEPDNQQTIFYSSTKLNDVNICDVCGSSCDGCASYFKRK